MRTTITWSDGSVSTRTVLNAKNFVDIQYKIETAEDEDDEFADSHRMDGGPACIQFAHNELIEAAWIENGKWSNSRLAAGLPTLWEEDGFHWNVENIGPHNPCGPAVCKKNGKVEYRLNGDKIDIKEYKRQYFVTHLKEFKVERKLYVKLYNDMMSYVEKELRNLGK